MSAHFYDVMSKFSKDQFFLQFFNQPFLYCYNNVQVQQNSQVCCLFYFYFRKKEIRLKKRLVTNLVIDQTVSFRYQLKMPKKSPQMYTMHDTETFMHALVLVIN